MEFEIDADGAPSWFRLQPLNRSVPPRAQSRPRPTDPLGAEPKQYHLSTGLAYADQATGSLQLPMSSGSRVVKCDELQTCFK